jgi:hypothetical protein
MGEKQKYGENYLILTGKRMFDEKMMCIDHKGGSKKLNIPVPIFSDIHPSPSRSDGQHLQAYR